MESEGRAVYRYIIPGCAVPQGRPRFTTAGGYPRAYDPPKSRAYKELIRRCVREQGAPRTPIAGPVWLKVLEYRAIPKSWSKHKRALALAGEIWPTTRPDSDNVKKGLMDACNGLVWEDDAQVIDSHVSKIYGAEPRLEVEVEG